MRATNKYVDLKVFIEIEFNERPNITTRSKFATLEFDGTNLSVILPNDVKFAFKLKGNSITGYTGLEYETISRNMSKFEPIPINLSTKGLDAGILFKTDSFNLTIGVAAEMNWGVWWARFKPQKMYVPTGGGGGYGSLDSARSLVMGLINSKACSYTYF